MGRKKGWSQVVGEVRFRAGYRGQEEPKEIVLQDRAHPVTSIISRKRVEERNPGLGSEVFLCRLDRGLVEVQVREDGTTRIFKRKNGG